jgi:G3E family GTPase
VTGRHAKRRGERIPVTVITGFLGSGKTTILSRLLRHPDLADTAVIVNEFGEVGLDHLLVTESEEDVVLLDSGCLCCAVSNALNETLNDLYFRRVRGDIPAFRRAAVETSGLADPAPILHTLMTDYFVVRHYALGGVVTVVDALHGAGQLDRHDEARKQAALADRIVITKTDLAEAGGVNALRRRLAELNPTARILEAVHGELDPAELLDVGISEDRDIGQWLGDEALEHVHVGDAKSNAHGHHDGAGHHEAHADALCVYLDGPISWPGYAAWLERLRRLPADSLLRVKGLIGIEGDGRPYVVQGVQHIFSPPARLPDWPKGDRRPRLVFITRGLNRADLEASLEALREPERQA